MNKQLLICDCTLRDGGYYTNWDFSERLVKAYFKALNEISAITHIEIGYRSMPQSEYFGEYFYCPEHVLRMARELCPTKQLAIMLNEKDSKAAELDILLVPFKKYIDLVRIAVDPANIERAVIFGKEIKSRGFKVAFNIMYMSQWASDINFIKKLAHLGNAVDYIYMVDSFGGVYPEDIKSALNTIKQSVNIPIGFHGHNNLEMGLANTLASIENGCEIVDATITGMGRGAGNLKMELLLISLSSKSLIPKTDYSKLNAIVEEFEKLQTHFKWGTNMPYMISGAYSLPQKEVMSWIAKNRFTTECIINALQNKKDKLSDNHQVPVLNKEFYAEEAIIIGGGPNAEKHAHALKILCKKNPGIILIHAGTRFVELFNELSNRQYYCLLGAEGSKLQKSLHKINLNHISVVLEPSPRKMGTILPEGIIPITFELNEISFMEKYPDSLLTIAFQLAIDLRIKHLSLFGLDGYDIHTEEQMIEVSKENQLIIDAYIQNTCNLFSLTPTFYQGFDTISIYSRL